MWVGHPVSQGLWCGCRMEGTKRGSGVVLCPPEEGLQQTTSLCICAATGVWRFGKLRVAHEAQFVRHKAGPLGMGGMTERCEDAQFAFGSKMGRVISLGHRRCWELSGRSFSQGFRDIGQLGDGSGKWRWRGSAQLRRAVQGEMSVVVFRAEFASNRLVVGITDALAENRHQAVWPQAIWGWEHTSDTLYILSVGSVILWLSAL